jgi:putative zinc finger/helix-turn-helix YgiT family protein
MKKNKLACVHEMMIERTVELTGERNGESFVVRVPGFVCQNCGFSTISSKQSGKFTQAVSDAYRRSHGLLTTVDLQQLRKQFDMSQVEFAEYLGVGAASVKRWECGQVQDKAMDELIRLKTDPDAALRNSNRLNARRQVLFESTEDVKQVYRPRAKMGLDTSSLEESDVFVGFDGPVAA